MHSLSGQTQSNALEGVVSYVTTQNVYVKFKSTKTISAGDTLFMFLDGNLESALVVDNLSSISCVCSSLLPYQFKIGDRIFAASKNGIESLESKPLETAETEPLIDPLIVPETYSLEKNETEKFLRKQNVSGRISVASYTNLSNTPQGNSQRMRYTLSLNAKNTRDSRLSAESYISFSHRSKQWNKIQDNVFTGLKIYNLSLKYELGKHASIWAGRKINPKISNMGAVDGIQFEYKTNSITTGVLAGSRPDYRDYSINPSLVQYGVYISHEHTYKRGNAQTSVAFVEQKNTGITDRRFTYLQHSNSLVKNLSLFTSAEFELYRYRFETGMDSTNLVKDYLPKLSNIYFSLRYRFSHQASLALSYSARQNIIYYETYKNFIDQLIESETQQGYSLQAFCNPIKKLSFGATGGYRFRKSDQRSSKNLYAYTTYSQIPYLDISATISATLMATSYMNGKIFGLSLSRDIIDHKLSSTVTYRFLDYRFVNSTLGQMQHTGEISLNWRIQKKLSCSFYYEGTFDSKYMYNRVFIQLSRRL